MFYSMKPGQAIFLFNYLTPKKKSLIMKQFSHIKSQYKITLLMTLVP